jgi:hypothetical protein
MIAPPFFFETLEEQHLTPSIGLTNENDLPTSFSLDGFEPLVQLMKEDLPLFYHS